jgi:hypothetical protein
VLLTSRPEITVFNFNLRIQYFTDTLADVNLNGRIGLKQHIYVGKHTCSEEEFNGKLDISQSTNLQKILSTVLLERIVCEFLNHVA